MRIVEHSLFKGTISNSSSLFFFNNSSFRNFTYLDICERASTKGMLMWSFLKISKNLLYRASSYCYCSLLENEILGLYVTTSGFCLGCDSICLSSLYWMWCPSKDFGHHPHSVYKWVLANFLPVLTTQILLSPNNY